MFLRNFTSLVNKHICGERFIRFKHPWGRHLNYIVYMSARVKNETHTVEIRSMGTGRKGNPGESKGIPGQVPGNMFPRAASGTGEIA